MDYNTDGARESLIAFFGDSLRNDPNFELLSPTSYQYNCIAYAMGMDDRWVDNADLPWHWWPPVKKGSEINHLKDAFSYFGFEECGLDDSIDPLYDKVALYKKSGCWSHAARIVGNGIYHSKFGESYDGRHSSGNVLKEQYGEICLIMRRLKSNSSLTEKRKGTPPGVIHLTISVTIDGHHDHLVTFGGKIYLAQDGREVKRRSDGSLYTV